MHLATVLCFPLLAILCFPARNVCFMFCALDSSFRFSCAFYQVFSRSTAVSCFPLLARVDTEFMIFSRSSHTFHVSRAWQQLQVFPRVSTSSPTLAAVSSFPALITGFIISAVLTSALVYYAAVICLVTQRRCPYSPQKGKEHCRDKRSSGFLDTLIRRICFLWFCFQRALALFILPPVHLLSISRPANLFSSSLRYWFILFLSLQPQVRFLGVHSDSQLPKHLTEDTWRDQYGGIRTFHEYHHILFDCNIFVDSTAVVRYLS